MPETALLSIKSFAFKTSFLADFLTLAVLKDKVTVGLTGGAGLSLTSTVNLQMEFYFIQTKLIPIY